MTKYLIIAFLCLTNYVSIGAVTTPPPEGVCLDASACNTAVCCQGPKGGYGSPGANGISGSPGSRGEIGSQGERGFHGEVGRPGDRGPSGPKGEAGYFGEGNPTPQSAFTALKTTSQRSYENNDILTFDLFESDTNGQFDLSSGTFTCRTPGTYMFMFSVYAYSSHTTVSLMKNGAVVVAAHHFHSMDDDTNTQIGNSAAVRLNFGDTVWLRVEVGNVIFGDSKKITSLTGFMLFGNSLTGPKGERPQ